MASDQQRYRSFDAKGQGGASSDNVLSPPSITVPRGGGAIRGIGEKFSANPVTGTGSMTVPIAMSPGRAGFGPQLSLSYDSGAGNGLFGFGWNLSLPAITRKTDKGLPQYRDAEESDVFILSSVEDLVPVLRDDGSRWSQMRTIGGVDYIIHRYRPRIEGLFARIERWTNVTDSGDVHWRSISRENILTLYGKDENSRIADPEDTGRIFSWLICETRDDQGNAVIYEYKAEDGTGVDLTQTHEHNRGDRDDPHRTASRYLKRIHYGNRVPLIDDEEHRLPFLVDTQIQNVDWMFEVVFDYGEHDADAPTPDDSGDWDYRADPFSSCRSGFDVRTTRLCQRVLMFHHFPDEDAVGEDCLVRSTDFTYSHEQDPAAARNPVYTFLLAVTQSGYKQQDASYLKRSLPPVEFEYTQPLVHDVVREVDAESLENLPVGLDETTYRWTDLHGEGIPGILTEQGGAWFYKRNLSPINKRVENGTSRVEATFAPVELVATKPKLALASGALFMDLAGDGQPDLVMMEGPTPGLYEHDGKEGWQPFRPFTSRLNRDFGAPNLRLVDLDGDGHADVLITENEALVWHASLAEAGFGPARRVVQALDEEEGPRLVFADGIQSIYLADMCGDGLIDLVRIRNGEVCYWPNLGYGRFGAKITMDHAPHFDNPDQFDQKRIRVGDIDGSGTNDIIYLHRNGVRLYFNQSGNRWSEPQPLAVYPHVDEIVSIQALDLLGNGTACLVWSSPLPGDAGRQMRYVDLMGGQKPHLLVKSINNLGAETRVHYAPSTKFYLQDKRDGTPWITRLPFVVHVVERVEAHDLISRNRFVTRYAYHHGRFDGKERESCGFGGVERWDTEEFAGLTAGGTFPEPTNLDEPFHMPPVHTKTWFHTGAYLDREHISRQFEDEYYREPGLTDDEFRALLLPDTTLPADLTPEEEREACRALKGMMLRQEVYADDASPGSSETMRHRAGTPYTVIEQDFSIRLLQHRASNHHAVFYTHPREAVTYHYERSPADPRIQHALTLEVDVYGNVLKAVAIGYGRRTSIRVIDAQGQVHQLPNPALAELEPTDQEKQTTALLTYTENRVTNAIDADDDYRTPLPCETRTFELTGYTPTGSAERYRALDFVEPDPAMPDRLHHRFTDEVAYETPPTANPCRRPIEVLRTLYRPDDMGAAQNDPQVLLALGVLDIRALPGEAYQLAFTPEHLSRVFGDRVTEAMLSDEGHYVHFDGDDNWWIPSGRTFFTTDPADTAAIELAQARQHFFLPRRYRDAFGEDAFVDFDANDLMMVETRDALDNRVTVDDNDYRVLQPRRISDPNRNQTEVAFDTLGLVVGTALMGKPPPAPVEGDSLAGFESDLRQDQIGAFFDALDPQAGAAALLQDATSRIVYDLDRFHRTQQAHPDDPTRWQPACAATLARETHVSDPLPPHGLRIQLGFTYSDGFGREIQTKMPAEPGPAPQRDADGRIIIGAGGQPQMTPDDVHPRWVGSGWTLFNNKGNPVRQFEPFFTDTHRFEFDVRIGVSPVLFYDPVERAVATLNPNHAWEKVVFDPWRQETWDVNDTVLLNPADDPEVGDFFRRLPDVDYLPTWHALRTDPARAGEAAARWPDPQRRADEASAAVKAAAHAETPGVVHLDALDRPFLSLADNGVDPPFGTRTEQDIEGAPLRVIDARGNPVMAYAVAVDAGGGPMQEVSGHDMAGQQFYENSMDGGERWGLADVAGNPIRAWDSRGHAFHTEYDPLRRSLRAFVTGADPDDPDRELLIDRLVYGEQHPDAEQRNLRGALYLHLDQAGVARSEAYDFKDNVAQASRQLASEYKRVLDWATVDGALPDDATLAFDPNVLDAAIAPLLEPGRFTTHTEYDALNRAVAITTPDNSLHLPTYNEAGLLERMEVRLRGDAQATLFVADIDYNAKGQRERIEYGNGVITDYAYDVETFRLTRLETIRPSFPTAERVLQDLRYAYDPAGNITSIWDHAQQTIYFANSIVEPHSDYTYDALYRLTEARGREHAAQNNSQRDATDFLPIIGLPFPNSPEALQRYREEYAYDEVGNILHFTHSGGGEVRWKRCYQYALNSNRLLGTSGVGEFAQQACPAHYVPGPASSLSGQYEYDAHGNMTQMPHLPLMRWDYRDQLQASSQQVVNNGGTPETTWYVYDAAGQRVRKVTERQADPGQTSTRMQERIYLGGIEIYREFNGNGATVTLERETLHIMDDQQRIVQIDTRTQGNDSSPAQSLRYQLSNHLGSAIVEVDELANVISYEEYHSYGTTAYRAGRSAAEVTLKRYRYTGKERDDETGLYYHGARYYACWLGRWASEDPVKLGSNINRYSYARCNPINVVDPTGEEDESINQVSPEPVYGVGGRYLVSTGRGGGKGAEILAHGREEFGSLETLPRRLYYNAKAFQAFLESPEFTPEEKSRIAVDVTLIPIKLEANRQREASKQLAIDAKGRTGPQDQLDRRNAAETFMAGQGNLTQGGILASLFYGLSTLITDDLRKQAAAAGTGAAAGGVLTSFGAPIANRSEMHNVVGGNVPHQQRRSSPKKTAEADSIQLRQELGGKHESRLFSLLEKIVDPGTLVKKPKIQTGRWKSESWIPDAVARINGIWNVFDAKLTKFSGRTPAQEHKVPVFEEKGGVMRKRGVLPKEGVSLPPSRVREITQEVLERFDRIFGKK